MRKICIDCHLLQQLSVDDSRRGRSDPGETTRKMLAHSWKPHLTIIATALLPSIISTECRRACVPEWRVHVLRFGDCLRYYLVFTSSDDTHFSIAFVDYPEQWFVRHPKLEEPR
jgi:hypothetical protein